MAKAPTFSARLAALRAKAGVTVYRLAKSSGVSPQHIARIERGEQSPSWEIAVKLARGLGVSVAAFDGGTDQ